MSVVVLDVFRQDRHRVALVANEKLVGAFGTDGTYEPLRIAVRSWGTRRRPHDCDVLTAKYLIERPLELGIPISDEEAEPERADPVGQIHSQVPRDLGDP
jgi:hypothetical protein